MSTTGGVEVYGDGALTPEQRARFTPWARDTEEVVGLLASELTGLSEAEASRRVEVVGRNVLPEAEKLHPALKFLSHFNDTLIYILLAAAVIKAIMLDWLDFWVIMAVALINAVIGFVQEGRAEKALAGIRGMLSATAQVRRDGAWKVVDAGDLVPGDIVRLAPGDKVPADMRLTVASQLRVDEAALTGESVPSSKAVEPVAADAGVGDRSSMVFSGTIVSAGQARAVVTATAGDTEIGTIQALVGEAGSLDTPLKSQLAAFGRVLTFVILGMGVVMLLIGLFLHRMDLDTVISATVGFAVAAIPEGLPALVTITLAIGVQQMAKRNAITRKLPAVETLGSVTVVCSDKTGTLTTNEMTVRSLVTPLGRYDVSGLGYQPEGAITDENGAAADGPDLQPLLAVASLCNDAHLVRDGERWQLVGEPTEGALKTLALKGGFDPHDHTRVGVLPFDSANKFMGTVDLASDGTRTLLVKGAPDRLLDRSTTQSGPEGSAPLRLDDWEAAIAELSGQGLRVLAAARRRDPAGEGDLDASDLQDLEFLGVYGIVDPPRPEVIQAVRDCHTAGVRVKMITGDHAGTALAIAREVGIVDDPHARVLTGAELETMSQDQLAAVAHEVDVYARTSPEHKIRIVRALQSHHEVVAMTGDGVNDAPALTRANVGVAMGIKGTEATKEAAEIVLADDNFATIRSAIREGRRIYDNLRKSVVFLLPTNGAQSLVILVAVLFGLTLPLTPVQVLWVNMITAVTLSLSLAYEPAERGIMQRPPRAPGGSIISVRELVFVLVVSLLIGGATLAVFYGAVARGEGVDMARTEAVLMLALGQLVFLFNCRILERSSFTLDVLRGNPVVWWSAAALMVLQAVYSYVPFMNGLFDSRPMPYEAWLIPLAYALALFLLIEGVKGIWRIVPERTR